jgi:hypothetical protein
MTVFLLEQTTHDISALRGYGEVEYIFAPGEARPSVWQLEFSALLAEKLEDIGFDPANDFIAFTGRLIPMMMLSSAVHRQYGSFFALLFDAGTQTYVERRF